MSTLWRGSALLCPLLAIALAAPASVQAKAPTIRDVVKTARARDPSRLETLLAAGAPANGRIKSRKTPLQAAAERNMVANVKTLIAHGAQLDAFGTLGMTALGSAVRKGHAATARVLLDAGANPDGARAPHKTPIALAIARGDSGTVELLIENGSKVFDEPELAAAALTALGETTDTDVVPRVVPRILPLIESSPAMLESVAEIVVLAPKSMGAALVRELGPLAATTRFHSSMLLAAVKYGLVDTVTDAIRQGADVEAKDRVLGTPLTIALGRRDRQTAGLLLSAGANPKAEGINEAVLEEVAGDVLADLRSLDSLTNKQAMDARDARGETSLFRAAQRGDFFLVTKLLERHADPSVTVMRWPGDAGWTPLMTAAAGGQTAVVELLLGAGAEVDQRNASGRTALHFAAWYGRARAAAALLAAGASNVPDRFGLTPAMLAQGSGEAATVGAFRDSRAAARDAALVSPR